jgi:[ribosomal protein S5]-alanine N-acetyltransferase
MPESGHRGNRAAGLTDPVDPLPTLTTPRLRLRHVRLTDVPRVLDIFGDPRAMRYWSHEPLADLAAAEAYVATIHRGAAEGTLLQWAVADPDTDELLGTVTLYDWSREHRRAGLGYMLAPDRWGQGFATEAAGAVVAHGFEALALHRWEADIHPANVGSQRVLERLGFRAEGRQAERYFVGGEWSDSVLFGLLRADWALSRAGSAG